MSEIEQFHESDHSLDSYWRSIILFGQNVASYKFALAKSLLKLSKEGRTSVTLEELAVPFSKNLCEHIAKSEKQCTSGSSKFLDACKGYNQGTISYDELISTTVAKGFNNVIDAFHVVNRETLPVHFYEKDYSRSSKRIILTDNVFNLQELPFSENLLQESEARWNLIETAWEMGISRNLLQIAYDENSSRFIIDDSLKRKDVTSARAALNGYQKGKCFYCFDDITICAGTDLLCDVDHFFPHTLQQFYPHYNFDGIWNLVLACPRCNRGEDGKFARVPALKYLERLNKRNEYLINSHHPLGEVIKAQTGKTAEARHHFLQTVYNIASDSLHSTWWTEPLGEEIF